MAFFLNLAISVAPGTMQSHNTACCKVGAEKIVQLPKKLVFMGFSRFWRKWLTYRKKLLCGIVTYIKKLGTILNKN